MNKIKLAFLTIILLHQVGCGDQRVIYQIKNVSEYKLKIDSYSHEDGKIENEKILYQTITLEPIVGFWQFSNDQTTHGSGWYYLGDSIVIDFDQTKRIIFTQSDLNPSRHLYNFEENYSKEIQDDTDIYTYSFTNEDYESAELIDPN